MQLKDNEIDQYNRQLDELYNQYGNFLSSEEEKRQYERLKNERVILADLQNKLIQASRANDEHIAFAMEQVSIGTEDQMRGVEEISSSSQSVSAAGEEQVASMQEISASANVVELKNLIGHFKV